MDTAFTTLELAYMGVGLAVASILAGILAGLLGVGGGILIVPALYWLFTVTDFFEDDLYMPVAVATSLATIITTSISSARAHHRKSAVDFDLLKRWAAGVALGAAAGGISAHFFDPDALTAVFGFVGLAVALNLATKRTLVIGEHLPTSRIVQGAISAIIGFVSALMGIGGGTLSVPTLAAFSYPIHRAVGTASALGLVIAVPAVIGFVVTGWNVPGLPPFSLGYVNLAATAIILPFTTFFAPYGARLSHRLDPIWVKRAFAIFLAITAARMLWSAFD